MDYIACIGLSFTHALTVFWQRMKVNIDPHGLSPVCQRPLSRQYKSHFMAAGFEPGEKGVHPSTSISVADYFDDAQCSHDFTWVLSSCSHIANALS